MLSPHQPVKVGGVFNMYPKLRKWVHILKIWA